jgi:hypothetical protein
MSHLAKDGQLILERVRAHVPGSASKTRHIFDHVRCKMNQRREHVVVARPDEKFEVIDEVILRQHQHALWNTKTISLFKAGIII